jgi:hypothetical protein
MTVKEITLLANVSAGTIHWVLCSRRRVSAVTKNKFALLAAVAFDLYAKRWSAK